MHALAATAISVCLTLSPTIAITPGQAVTVISEAAKIWRPLGVSLRRVPDPEAAGCDRVIAVKSHLDARAEDAAPESALAWVPFVEGHARQVVFLRLDRAHLLIDAISPPQSAEGLTGYLLAKFVGRTLAHELGHVLLNSRNHPAKGLMRATYRAQDVLRNGAATYALSAPERAQLFAQLSRQPRLAAR